MARPRTIPERASQAAIDLYDLLAEHAVDGVYEGSVVVLYDQVVSSRRYYMQVMQVLEQNDAIEILQRGHGLTPTRVAIGERPDISSLRVLTPAGQSAITALEQRVSDIETLVGGMSIRQALAEVEKRIQALESASDAQPEG